MPLINLELAVAKPRVPADVRAFLREAVRRVHRFHREHHAPAFVPSNYGAVYATLHTLAEADLAPGTGFCEWGSGLGVVACLAAMLGFDACGIEIEPELIEESRQLAEDFGLPVEFVQGSYIPRRSEQVVGSPDTFAWLGAADGDAYQELDRAAEDYGLIFAYPWPDEEWAIEALFEHCASDRAVLVSYHGLGRPRVRQKSVDG